MHHELGFFPRNLSRYLLKTILLFLYFVKSQFSLVGHRKMAGKFNLVSRLRRYIALCAL